VTVDLTSPSMGTTPSELEVLELAADHSEWVDARVVV
jgi:hypothetical protein